MLNLICHKDKIRYSKQMIEIYLDYVISVPYLTDRLIRVRENIITYKQHIYQLIGNQLEEK